MLFVMFYTDSGRQIVAISVRYCIIALIALPLVYLKEMTFSVVLSEVSLLVGITALMSVIAMMLQYISELHWRMKLSNEDNIKMLDGMHEGLLILSKHSEKPLFCNKPA